MSALQRWDGFLAQIEGRHRQVIADGEASIRQQIASIAGGGDVLPISHQLMAVKSRLQQLQTMIPETWHAKVEDAIFADGHGVPERDAAWAKGEVLRHRMDDETEELEPRLLSELARQRFQHAQAQHRPARCAHCGAELAVGPAFRIVEVACPCGARTAVEPSELMRSVAAVGTHALAQEQATQEWRAMRVAERRLHAIRPPRPLDVVVEYERAQIAYWRRYLGARSQMEPELARDPALEIRSRMEQWYTSGAEAEESWVRAGRPRQI
ncbi:MAG TPA: hypothetical protein VFQ53_40460 [Kofleriaceae bacterium]|nr:hypothetical protein [Kofleriaceae bacterium]